MSNNRRPSYFSARNYKVIIAMLAVLILLLVLKKNGSVEQPSVKTDTDQTVKNDNKEKPRKAKSNNIDELTAAEVVIPYVKEHKRLPDYYITKKEARRQGWNPAKGNLCDVLPGRVIGGDVFSNREGRLPVANRRKWFEADLNYQCGNRNADRLLFSTDGLVFITTDHYKNFTRQ